ncbi:PREDICTED: protein SABRE-like isoform X1 [Camelina sativa]|uniref:Protein SABRE-like isoform X1 n=1 Tax=Camelina sativa TaxID=90675 RepID=A0ABM1Q8Q7_CAMSA|nr:PREDICTED: protein SABRE-like isoform X1 [Camelina sativa]
MAASPAKFFFGFLIVSIVLWMIFILCSRLFAWMLSRVLGASVVFRIGGWKCLKDVVVKFKKGAIESVSASEIKLSLRQSLVKLGVGFLSRDPKVQILISDLEVVMRSSTSTTNLQKAKSQKSRTSGRGKWMVVANVARFLSLSVADMVVKTRKVIVEVKELKLDINKDGGTKPNLYVKLNVLPILVHLCESRIISDQSSNVSFESCTSPQASSASPDRSSAALFCDELSLSSEFGHDRAVGIVVRNVEVISGDVILNFDEDSFPKSKQSSAPVHSDEVRASATVASFAKKPHKENQLLAALAKYSPSFPDKVSFSLPKLDVRCVNREHDLLAENNITGIHLRSVKSKSFEDTGESTRLDVQMELSEIHFFKEAEASILEIMKVDVVSFIYIPIQPVLPVRAEVDIKLGGTRCNLFISRLQPWLRLHFLRKKKLVLQEKAHTLEKTKAADMKAIMWTGTVSAPEMTVMLYGVDDLPMYHFCSQSSHVFANNISSLGTSVHVELGELNLHLADEYQECFKEHLFGIEPNSGSLMHIAKISLDWGRRDRTSSDEVGFRSKLVLSVDVTGMGIYLSFKRVESIITNAMTYNVLFKTLSVAGKKRNKTGGVQPSKASGKGTRLVNLNLERCCVNFCDDTGLDNTIIDDPKSVNYGSQGGRVSFRSLADGTPRTASILSTAPEVCKRLKYSVSLEISQFSVCLNKDKHSTQVELERAKSIYQEYLEEHKPCSNVTLFDMHNAKLVRRSGGLNEIDVCSLFSATHISLGWEPDVHLSFYELFLRLRSLVYAQRHNGPESGCDKGISSVKDGGPSEKTNQSSSVDKQKKKESMFAIDVETLTISAEVGDGVEVTLEAQSIFSENACIGVLLEGLMLAFNGSRVFKTTRMQISRIPTASLNLSDTVPVMTGGPWDWVVQGLDMHICMPYKLQLRAIDDSIEEMLRGLKLISAAKGRYILSRKRESSKPKKSGPKFGRIRFCIRRLTADIEEEPIQGWLDEHYQLVKKEACELAVRLKFLEDLIHKASQAPKGAETSDASDERRMFFDGVEIDVEDPLAINKVKEEIHKRSFQSYYQACQGLAPSEGSGACREGFQAGFKPSARRTSLLSVSATDFDLSLTAVHGGDAGLIEVLKKLDPICQENDIPFSRLYGSNIYLNTGCLVVQLRDYTLPLLSGTSGKCEGRIVLAQQATCFQPQISQDVFVGRWRKVRMFRSASGTTPPLKTYSDLRIHFEQGEVSFGVGYEPAFADISYAFTVALRRANLSHRNPGMAQVIKKERSLPWWDDMRNYVHGNITLSFSESNWSVLATTDPYESLDKLQIVTGPIELQQSDGRVFVNAKDFKIKLSSLESLISRHSLKVPVDASGAAFIEAPDFNLEVTMDWDCESGNSLNHYLYAFPAEGKPREKVFDPFRSTSLSLRWNFSLRPEKFHQSSSGTENPTDVGTVYTSQDKPDSIPLAPPVMNLGAHDLAWILKFWGMNYYPPHKLRSFSRWPRFGVPRAARSGNLSMDKVMMEFMLRVDATPSLIKYMPWDSDDPAKGLTFNMAKLKYELCYSRGKQKYTFECKRDALDLVYQGLDLHVPKAFIDKDEHPCIPGSGQFLRKGTQNALIDRVPSGKDHKRDEKHRDEGFLLSSDYFTIRRQAPKADPERLLAWQEAGRRNLEMTYVRSEFENGSESDEHIRSDPSDDDGYNVVIADNCQRVFVYGLKLLWTIENRDAVWSFVGGISKAFEPPKPSPSRQYTQRKLHEENQKDSCPETHQGEMSRSSASPGRNLPSQPMEMAKPPSSPSHSLKIEKSDDRVGIVETIESEEEGTRHFMVNVIEPQFNLHSEDANGRFLLAAVSGRVLARSFHSVMRVGVEVIEQALGSGSVQIPDSSPEMTWTRMEVSVMLEHVQAHVAPTDVDPGAGLQWLPKIRRNSPKVKRTGALLERVFMPCDMYFRYTRHKGGTPDLKVKPLKELTFNSHNIIATMTSRQFQVMLDVLTNLLFARLPKPRKSSLQCPTEDEDVEEEADEVVPYGVEEVELAKINLEEKERERKLLLDDIRKLSHCSDNTDDTHMEREGELWMISTRRSILVQGLKKELTYAQKSRKAASASLRMALQKAAQLRIMEKEKNKSPSYAMCISLQINKVVWSMLVDGKSFAEAEINDLIYDFDRDYKDIGVARFTTKYFVVRNCLPNAKSDMLLSAWNPPPEWGKKVMLRVDAKQGAPRDGHYPLELFHVEIYPLRIHLTETMYRMMWEYFFPEEEQDSQRRQEVWKISTTAGSKRVKKGLAGHESSGTTSHALRDVEASRVSSAALSSSAIVQSQTNADSVQKPNILSLRSSTGGSAQELRRTSSFDRSWEENVAESVANELVLQAHSCTVSSSIEQQEDSSKQKVKEMKPVKSGRSSHEEKKAGKSHEEKKSRPRKMMEFHNIKISQVELLVTYEGSRFVVNDLKLLMDTFHGLEFTGTWRRLFSRVKKHIIWGVLKSVTGMQGKKFKDKSHNNRESTDNDLNLSDNDQTGKPDQQQVTWFKRQSDGAGDGFVTSIRGLFNTQRRKAKAFVLRTMRGEAENDFHGDWSDSDVEFSPFARQLTITKAKRLLKRHTKKFRPRSQRDSTSQQRESLPSSPRETTAFESGYSSGSSPYEDFRD